MKWGKRETICSGSILLLVICVAFKWISDTAFSTCFAIATTAYYGTRAYLEKGQKVEDGKPREQ